MQDSGSIRKWIVSVKGKAKTTLMVVGYFPDQPDIGWFYDFKQ